MKQSDTGCESQCLSLIPGVNLMNPYQATGGDIGSQLVMRVPKGVICPVQVSAQVLLLAGKKKNLARADMCHPQSNLEATEIKKSLCSSPSTVPKLTRVLQGEYQFNRPSPDCVSPYSNPIEY